MSESEGMDDSEIVWPPTPEGAHKPTAVAMTSARRGNTHLQKQFSTAHLAHPVRCRVLPDKVSHPTAEGRRSRR